MTARRSIGPQAPLAVTFALAGILFAISARAATPDRLDVGGGSAPTEELRSAAADRLRSQSSAAPPHATHPFTVVTPNDSFFVLWHGFDDPQLSCQPRGWTGQDLTTQVYAHVTPANTWVVNNGFVNMGTRAFWFGTDSVAAPTTVANWVKGFGYDNGWSQRLTSPTFSLAANPGATLRFDVAMELDRSLDTPATSTFTPFGLASGAVANDLLGVQARRTDGSWAFLNGRFSLSGGPASWEQTPPLFVNRYTEPGMSAPNGIAKDDSGNVYVADRGNHRILKYTRSGQFLMSFGSLGGNAAILAPKTDYATGVNPNSIATGDFNRDGIPDLVMANQNQGTISVMLGDGTGGFPSRADIDVGSDPYAVAVGDLGDGDGRLDLAVADYSDSEVKILRGNGSGGFTPAGAYGVESEPLALVVQDVNGNGRPDLVVVNSGSSSMSVLLDSEGESFSGQTDYVTGGIPLGLAVGDVTNDGRPDILVANSSSSSVSLFRNLGGSFAPKVDLPCGGAPMSVAIGYLDQDGFADLAIATHSADIVEVKLGTGAGGFTPSIPHPTGVSGENPIAVAIGDLNGDGKLDLISTNQLGHTASLFLGTGTGGFAAATNFSTGTQPVSLALADLNRDGTLDIATTNANAATISILLANAPVGSDTPGDFPNRSDWPVGGSPYDVELAKLDVDNLPDLLSTVWNGAMVALLRGDGAGGFQSPDFYSTGNNPASIAVGDLDGDSSNDIVTANLGDNTVSVLLSNGDGGFQTKTDYPTGIGPVSVAVGDFNRDGRLDLVTTNLTANTISVLVDTVGPGEEHGFAAKTDFPTPFGPIAVAVGDLNRDGMLDVAVACNNANAVSVLLGNGSGGFPTRTEFTVGATPQGIAIGDLNRDGIPDIVASNASSSSVSVLLGDGLGGFPFRGDHTVDTNPVGVVIRDMSGDGKLDIAVSTYSGVATVLLGDGAGGVTTTLHPATGVASQAIAVGDVNLDGRPDLAVANYSDNDVSVLLGNGAGANGVRFVSPFDVHADNANNLYVVDATDRVQKFDTMGNTLGAWGSTGAGPGQFDFPIALASDSLNNIYVCDQNNGRVQKFTSSGVYVSEFAAASPGGIAVGDSNYVYVSEPNNGRVVKFYPNGVFGLQIGTAGIGDGQFSLPSGIALDRTNTVWVVDRGNHRIQRFTDKNVFLMKSGSLGAGGGHFFDTPRDIAISRGGDVYVVESANHRYQWFAIGGPIAGEKTFKYEARLRDDGNQDLALADPAQVRIVMQTSLRSSPADGSLIPGQLGIVLVDNLSLKNASNANVLAPVTFEGGNTGAWTTSARNGAYTTDGNIPSAIRDFPAPATSVALRSGFDSYNPSCAWTFLSPGDTLRDGVYARLTSPWVRLAPGFSNFYARTTSRMNTLRQSCFLQMYTRGKNSGDPRPRAINKPNALFYGTSDPDEANSPLVQEPYLDFPSMVSGPVATDSVQIVIEVLDQPERLLGVPAADRPTAHVPVVDEVQLIQIGPDDDFDGVANGVDDVIAGPDDCTDECAAGQDADGDGCVDETATLRHVESWASGNNITYSISTGGTQPFTAADLAAVRAGFNTWKTVTGSSVPLVEVATTTQTDANMLDGINRVTRQDDYQFEPGVLGITPTTSFTRRYAFRDAIVLPGQIVDSDLIVNPETPFTNTNEAGEFDLQSVVTHEAGHLLGIGHSGVLDATMFFVIQPKQDARSLTDDDRSAIAAAYPSAQLATNFATIRGQVFDGSSWDGEGFFGLPGALVTAVRDSAGSVVDSTASDYTDENGRYALHRLPPGSYSVRITPLDGNVGGFPFRPENVSQRVFDSANTNFTPEWWTHDDTERDAPTLRDTLILAAAIVRTEVNVITTIDTIPPLVAATLPADQSSGISVGTSLLVNFNGPVDPSTLKNSFRLRKDGLPPSIEGRGKLLNGTNFVFTPTLALDFLSDYELEISPGLKDLSGLALADTFRAVFTTEPVPAVTIADIQPRSVPIGGLVTITGTGFYPSDSVFIEFCDCANEVPLNTTPNSIVVRVPVNAIGTVRVFTSRGSSNTETITILPPVPQVSPTPDGPAVSLGTISPTDVAVSPDGGLAYAAGDNGFATVNLGVLPRAAIPRLTAGRYRGLALTPDGTRAVLGRASSGEVLVVNALDGPSLGIPVTPPIVVGGEPSGVAISPDGKRAFVTDRFAGLVHEIDIDPVSIAPYAHLREIALPGVTLSGGIAVSLDGTRLYLSSSNQGLLRIDLAEEDPVPLAVNPAVSDGGVAITPAGDEVLAPGGLLSSNLVIAKVPVSGPPFPITAFIGGAPRDIAVTPEGQSALVVDSQNNALLAVGTDPSDLATYHKKVSTVGTGQSPLSVAHSSLGPTVAVANYGDRSISLYTTQSADATVQRAVPDIAAPGDMVAVQTVKLYGIGTDVDLGGGSFPATNTPGRGVGFAVPLTSPKQISTTVTLEDLADIRSRSLPFEVIESLPSLAATPSGVVTTLPTAFCSGDNDQGLAYLSRTSPDGRMVAVAVAHNSGCWIIHLFRIAPSGPDPAGKLLTSITAGAQVVDMAFTANSRRLWVTHISGDGEIYNTDEATPSLGQSLGEFASSNAAFTTDNIAADPLGRFMVAATHGAAASAIELFDPATGNFLTNIPTPNNASGPIAVSPDGRYVVKGTNDGATFLHLNSQTLATPPGVPTSDGQIRSLAISTNGKRAFGRFSGGQIGIWSLDPTNVGVGAELYFGSPTAASLGGLVPAPDGSSVLAFCTNCNDLLKIDPATATPTVSSVDVGQPFTTMTRSADGRRLWGVNSVQGFTPVYFGDLEMFNLSPAAALRLISGAGQQALASTQLPRPIRVRIVDASGQPEEGVVLRFALANGVNDGTLDGTTAGSVDKISNVNGEAEVTWQTPSGFGVHHLLIQAMGIAGATLDVTCETVANDADIVPQVVEFGPASGQLELNALTAVFARFNQRMDATQLPNFMKLFRTGQAVTGRYSFEDDGRVAVFFPTEPLPFGGTCALIVENGAPDLDGDVTAATQQTSFRIQAPPALTLSALQPPAADPGATVVIAGEGFNPTTTANIVTFNGVLAPVRAATLNALTTVVPTTATSGPLRVQIGNSSAETNFSVLAPNPTPGSVVDNVPHHKGVSRVAFTPDGTRAYISNTERNSVVVLDIATATIITEITVGESPVGIAVLPDNSRAYVANSGSDDVSVIDIVPTSNTYNRVVNTIKVGDEPVDVVATARGPKVWVANYTSGDVSVIDANPDNGTFDEVVKTVTVGSGCASVVITADEGRIYAGIGTGVVYVDLNSPDQAVKTISSGSGCASIIITADQTIVLALLYDGTLLVISSSPGPSFNQVVKTVSTGSGATSVVVSPDEAVAYVTSADGNVVFVYKIDSSDLPSASSSAPGPSITLTLIGTIDVGLAPSDIAINPSGGRLGLVTNTGDGTITIIDFSITTPPLEVLFDFEPNNIDLKKMDGRVKGYIEPPAPYLASEIVISSIRFNNVVMVDMTHPPKLGDHIHIPDVHNDHIPDLKVEFQRGPVALTLTPGKEVGVKISGTIGNRTFVGWDTVKVKAPKVKKPHHLEYVNPLVPYTAEWEVQDDEEPWVALLHSMDHGQSWKLDALRLPNTGSALWTPPNVIADSVLLAVVQVEIAAPGDTLVTGVVTISDYFNLRTPVGVELLPARLEFAPIHPSPSVREARLHFGLPRATQVDLEIFDVQGRRLATLISGPKAAGWHDVTWEGRTDAGDRAGAGLYFARFRAEGKQFKQRLIWLR